MSNGTIDVSKTPKLNTALVAARIAMKNPAFDSSNPYFESKFASLKAVIAAVTSVFAEHGLAFVQDVQTLDGGIGCYTHILHSSGEERVFGPLVMHPTKNDAQGQGSACTYARRYHLMSIAGVVGDDDDDGNQASTPKESNAITTSQVADLRAKIDEVGADPDGFMQFLRVKKLEDLPSNQYEGAIAALDKKANNEQ